VAAGESIRVPIASADAGRSAQQASAPSEKTENGLKAKKINTVRSLLYRFPLHAHSGKQYLQHASTDWPYGQTSRTKAGQLSLADRAAWMANQSNKPAVSARAEIPIMPRKKKNAFHSRSRVASASEGLISPRIRRMQAPPIAMTASFHRNGRVMMPISVRIPTRQVSKVFVNSGMGKY
jgi:hypothetical protein